MRDPNTQTTKEIETDDSASSEEVFELGQVSDTKGGPGNMPDCHGGLMFC
jgi:hypothetical protein